MLFILICPKELIHLWYRRKQYNSTSYMPSLRHYVLSSLHLWQIFYFNALRKRRTLILNFETENKYHKKYIWIWIQNEKIFQISCYLLPLPSPNERCGTFKSVFSKKRKDCSKSKIEWLIWMICLGFGDTLFRFFSHSLWGIIKKLYLSY